ncbi:hypothetical protein L3X38_034424 [Prunus dulcis]|uniref:Uncharacterized protein n=1 Tax=Prunus dulcis TaxID=3755 RepID=A0AAD4VHT2_PRUDU|nr:hypothetical protein L3X38_034424 [Prunus dulcis]
MASIFVPEPALLPNSAAFRFFSRLIGCPIELLVENRITWFSVIDDDWEIGRSWFQIYDLLALDTISGQGRTDTQPVSRSGQLLENFQRGTELAQ